MFLHPNTAMLLHKVRGCCVNNNSFENCIDHCTIHWKCRVDHDLVESDHNDHAVCVKIAVWVNSYQICGKIAE